MTAYESLNRVRVGKAAYERLLARVEELQSLAEKTTPIITGMPHGGNQLGKTDEPWAALADYKEECKEQLLQYLKDCKELEIDLDCIKNPRIRVVMQYRYIDLRRADDIAVFMDIDERTVYRLLKKGRQIYETYWEEKYGNKME